MATKFVGPKYVWRNDVWWMQIRVRTRVAGRGNSGINMQLCHDVMMKCFLPRCTKGSKNALIEWEVVS